MDGGTQEDGARAADLDARLQGVTMAPVRGTKDKRDSRRKIRKLVLN